MMTEQEARIQLVKIEQARGLLVKMELEFSYYVYHGSSECYEQIDPDQYGAEELQPLMDLFDLVEWAATTLDTISSADGSGHKDLAASLRKRLERITNEP